MLSAHRSSISLTIPRQRALPRRLAACCFATIFGALFCFSRAAVAIADAPQRLMEVVRKIESSRAGELGVYVKRLSSGHEFDYRAAETWYLASVIKVPLAIAVLQTVEKGDLSLRDSIELQESDYVDGTGRLLYQKPGSRHRIAELVAQSLEHSDSTATDILIRQLGVQEFNRSVKRMVGEGFEPFTTILQVRYDAYGELHPDAAKLSNMDYVKFRNAEDYPGRVAAFQQKLNLAEQDLKVVDLETAFERYYQRELNSGTLVATGILLERLVRGELLNSRNTRRVLRHMEKVSTGDDRLKGGLPKGVPFAQKTGTQINRACNVGVTHPQSPRKAMVMVVCARGFGELEQAEASFREIAAAVWRHDWTQSKSDR